MFFEVHKDPRVLPQVRKRDGPLQFGGIFGIHQIKVKLAIEHILHVRLRCPNEFRERPYILLR
jgi:hypothetical protein